MNSKDNKYIEYWIELAKHDLDVAVTLFNNKKYDSCLYFCHLSIEKLLKALWIKNNNSSIPPKTHNLHRLAQETNEDFKTSYVRFFEILNEFHIEARYPDYKLSFYKLCTHDFTIEKFNMTKELFECILGKI